MVGTTCGALSFGSWLLAESCCAAGPEARWRSGRWRPCRDRTGDLARRAAMRRHGCCRPDAHAPVCQVRGSVESTRARRRDAACWMAPAASVALAYAGADISVAGSTSATLAMPAASSDGDRCEDAAPGSEPAKQHRGQCEAAGDPAANGGGQAEAGAVERPVVARAREPRAREARTGRGRGQRAPLGARQARRPDVAARARRRGDAPRPRRRRDRSRASRRRARQPTRVSRVAAGGAGRSPCSGRCLRRARRPRPARADRRAGTASSAYATSARTSSRSAPATPRRVSWASTACCSRSPAIPRPLASRTAASAIVSDAGAEVMLDGGRSTPPGSPERAAGTTPQVGRSSYGLR